MIVDVIIPALNEEHSVGKVVHGLTDTRIREVYVVDNGSSDRTAEVASAAGAKVLVETTRGYGAACLRGLSVLSVDPPETVLFLDADFSDFPEEASQLLDVIEQGAELVIGSRVLGNAGDGALLPQARFGNWLATRLIRLGFGEHFTDLGPFRACRWAALESLQMEDMNFGWTVEMQVRAARQGLRSEEVPVSYRRRIGTSKVTGTFRGSISAGVKILWVIGREFAVDKGFRVGMGDCS